MSEPARHVSGFVSLIGRPNAGKSTLLNALLGTKVAIVASKPQTTRTAIQGVLTLPGAQIIFVDTPGIVEPKNLLHRRMQQRIREALEGRDLILFVVDATLEFGPEDERALGWIAQVRQPVLLVLNKIDALERKEALLPLIEQYRQRHQFEEYLPISALTGEGLEALREAILKRLPEGPRYFPEDHLTNQPERFLVAELIREKILHHTHQEVPHCVAVVVEHWQEEERPGGARTRISATIHVERPGQKAILIGEKGSMLKKIGTDARLEIEALLGRKVFLELFVKVSPDWRQRASFLDELEATSVASAN